MSKKIIPFALLFLLLNIPFVAAAQTDIPTPTQRIRPKDKSFSTYITISGFTQNINIGLESNQYYSNTGTFNSSPIAALKYLRNQKHCFGLKAGVFSNSESYTKTDSVLNKTYISTIERFRIIWLNSNYDGFSQDDISTNIKNFTFIPFYEYHFKGNKRWDYYVALEYLFNITMRPKSKNKETLIYTNDNNDRIEYTYRTTKGSFLRNHGGIATFGVNYFFYKWLSVGTKISVSKQVTFSDNNSFEEKLLVNGIDQTSDLNISNTSKIKHYKSSTTYFLGSYNGAFISYFNLPFLINFYL